MEWQWNTIVIWPRSLLLLAIAVPMAGAMPRALRNSTTQRMSSGCVKRWRCRFECCRPFCSPWNSSKLGTWLGNFEHFEWRFCFVFWFLFFPLIRIAFVVSEYIFLLPVGWIFKNSPMFSVGTSGFSLGARGAFADDKHTIVTYRKDPQVISWLPI